MLIFGWNLQAIIGMFFQDGLTGSAWGDWSLYTTSPLRAGREPRIARNFFGGDSTSYASFDPAKELGVAGSYRILGPAWLERGQGWGNLQAPSCCGDQARPHCQGLGFLMFFDKSIDGMLKRGKHESMEWSRAKTIISSRWRAPVSMCFRFQSCRADLPEAMYATIGYIVPEYYKFPGYLSPSLGLKFADVPNGLAALSQAKCLLASRARGARNEFPYQFWVPASLQM